jgi:hypothetical protein
MPDVPNSQSPEPTPSQNSPTPGTGPLSDPMAPPTPEVAPGEVDPQREVVPRGPDRRKNVVDRRAGVERRQQTREESGYTGPERRSGVDRRSATGLERRRGPGRRRSDERKSAEEGEMTAEQFEFIQAIQTYKKVNKKLYPTWTEVLEVVRQLGYRKVLPREIRLENVPEPKVFRGTEAA